MEKDNNKKRENDVKKSFIWTFNKISKFSYLFLLPTTIYNIVYHGCQNRTNSLVEPGTGASIPVWVPQRTAGDQYWRIDQIGQMS